MCCPFLAWDANHLQAPVQHASVLYKFTSLIKAVFSSKDEGDMIRFTTSTGTAPKPSSTWRQARSPTTDQKEMLHICVQDARSPRNSSEAAPTPSWPGLSAVLRRFRRLGGLIVVRRIIEGSRIGYGTSLCASADNCPDIGITLKCLKPRSLQWMGVKCIVVGAPRQVFKGVGCFTRLKGPV